MLISLANNTNDHFGHDKAKTGKTS